MAKIKKLSPLEMEKADMEDVEQEVATSEYMQDNPEESGLMSDQELINQEADSIIAEEKAKAPPASRRQPMSAPEAKASAPQDEYGKLLEQYRSLRDPDNLRSLQDQQRNAMLTANMVGAGSKIAQGFARRYGADPGDNSEGVDMLKQMAQQPVKDYTVRRDDVGSQVKQSGDLSDLELKQQLNDPKSDISSFARQRAVEIMKRMNKDFDGSRFDNMSAAQLEKLGFKNTVGSNKASQLRFERIRGADGTVRSVAIDPISGEVVNQIGEYGFAGQSKIDPRTGEIIQLVPSRTEQTPTQITKPTATATAKADQQAKEETGIEINKGIMNPAQSKLVDDSRKNFIDEAKDDIGALQAAQGVTRVLNGPSEGKLDQDIIRAIQNQLARASGERGAMTEGDVTGFGGRGALMDRLERMLTIQTTGKLPEEDRKLLKNLAGIMEQRAKDFIQQRSDFYTENLNSDLSSSSNFEGKKINKQSINKLLGAPVYTQGSAPAATPPQGDTVKVKGPSGQVATMTKDNAKKYLAKPGYEVVK